MTERTEDIGGSGIIVEKKRDGEVTGGAVGRGKGREHWSLCQPWEGVRHCQA